MENQNGSGQGLERNTAVEFEKDQQLRNRHEREQTMSRERQERLRNLSRDLSTLTNTHWLPVGSITSRAKSDFPQMVITEKNVKELLQQHNMNFVDPFSTEVHEMMYQYLAPKDEIWEEEK